MQKARAESVLALTLCLLLVGLMAFASPFSAGTVSLPSAQNHLQNVQFDRPTILNSQTEVLPRRTKSKRELSNLSAAEAKRLRRGLAALFVVGLG